MAALGEQHPTVAIRLNNLAHAAAGHQPHRGSRTADAEGAGNRRRPPSGDQHPNAATHLNNSGDAATGHSPHRGSRTADADGRWKSTKPHFGEQHPSVATRSEQLGDAAAGNSPYQGSRTTDAAIFGNLRHLSSSDRARAPVLPAGERELPRPFSGPWGPMSRIDYRSKTPARRAGTAVSGRVPRGW